MSLTKGSVNSVALFIESCIAIIKMFHRRRHAPQLADGFTLIELLVVIVMIGTVAAIAAPSWQGFLDRQRMNAIRGELMGVLRDAQEEAQNRQQNRQVIFSGAAAPISVTVRSASASTGGITKTLGSDKTSSKFTLSAPATIVFDNDGRVNVPTPYVMKITKRDAPLPPSGQSPAQSCVVVTTLLGGMKPANNHICDSF